LLGESSVPKESQRKAEWRQSLAYMSAGGNIENDSGQQNKGEVEMAIVTGALQNLVTSVNNLACL